MRSTRAVVIDGYDLLAENARLDLPDHTVGTRSLNRGTAEVAVTEGARTEDDAVREGHRREVFPTTLPPGAPVVDLSYPSAGMFVASPAGTYLDLYQGVAQKLIDDRHPRLLRVVDALAANGLAFRREIAAADYLTFSEPIEGLHTAGELAALVNGLTGARFPGLAPYRTFFSNSGAESGEAAIKLAQLHAYRRVIARHGPELLARVMEQLGIERVTRYDAEPTSLTDDVYADYPFFVFACERAFHGRTLGVLSLTASKKAQHVGYSKIRWVHHVPFNGEVEDFASRLDTRPLPEIVDAPGGVREVVESGRVPAELCAMFAVECYQGEGGYRLADRAWLKGIADVCRAHDILFGVDEVQTFGRTGLLYAIEHFDIEPDVIWTSKATVVGLTIARGDLADDCHLGWHANTFGGGKVFDVNLAYAVIDTLVNYEDPLFEGRSYLENCRVKGMYMRSRLADLLAEYSDVLDDFSGLGGLWGLSVYHRDDVIRVGWESGLKLLGCGWGGELSRIRLVLLADVLTREIDAIADGLGRVLERVEEMHEDD